jgi:hypothetical protein
MGSGKRTVICPACGGKMRLIAFGTEINPIGRIPVHPDGPIRPPFISPARSANRRCSTIQPAPMIGNRANGPRVRQIVRTDDLHRSAAHRLDHRDGGHEFDPMASWLLTPHTPITRLPSRPLEAGKEQLYPKSKTAIIAAPFATSINLEFHLAILDNPVFSMPADRPWRTRNA